MYLKQRIVIVIKKFNRKFPGGCIVQVDDNIVVFTGKYKLAGNKNIWTGAGNLFFFFHNRWWFKHHLSYSIGEGSVGAGENISWNQSVPALFARVIL